MFPSRAEVPGGAPRKRGLKFEAVKPVSRRTVPGHSLGAPNMPREITSTRSATGLGVFPIVAIFVLTGPDRLDQMIFSIRGHGYRRDRPKLLKVCGVCENLGTVRSNPGLARERKAVGCWRVAHVHRRQKGPIVPRSVRLTLTDVVEFGASRVAPDDVACDKSQSTGRLWLNARLLTGAKAVDRAGRRAGSRE